MPPLVDRLTTLQGRTAKLSDIPVLAPFFFVEPDYPSMEAQKMRGSLSTDHYSKPSSLLQFYRG